MTTQFDYTYTDRPEQVPQIPELDTHIRSIRDTLHRNSIFDVPAIVIDMLTYDAMGEDYVEILFANQLTDEAAEKYTLRFKELLEVINADVEYI